LLALLLAACALAVVCRLEPPDAVPAAASPTEFSSGRAMQHLRLIAQQPHPVGSPEHAAVRDYILQELARLGLRPEVQTTPVVHNIVARLAGTAQSGRAILLVAHYDTVPVSPGASDDGSGVVVLLETLRALKAGTPLRNDVIALFSDGEEIGQLGAKAFAYGHPWAKDVGLVFNFEARGSGGPALMFETSGGNGWLMRHFAAAAPHPVAYSLSYGLYRLMPNDTDLTILKEVGLPGLNFAFIKHGATHYHSPLDNLANIDERSVQHQGTYALGLTRHFGNLSLAHPTEPDVIYFNLFGSRLIVYSEKWVVPLAILCAALWVVVGLIGWRAQRLKLAEVGPGLAAMPLGVVIGVLGGAAARWLLSALLGGGGGATDGRGGDVVILMLATLAIAIMIAFYSWCGRKVGGVNLLFGGSLWWLLLLLLTSLFWPGGSYLFAWPLLPVLCGLALDFGLRDSKVGAAGRFLLLVLGALTGVALFAPVVYLSLLAFSLNSSGAAFILAAPVALILILLVPYFAPTNAARARLALS
jgi:hypothetical protein